MFLSLGGRSFPGPVTQPCVVGFLGVICDVAMVSSTQRQRDVCVEMGAGVRATGERFVDVELAGAADSERAWCLAAEAGSSQRRLAHLRALLELSESLG